MPYDAGAAAAVCREFSERAAGGRIEKIFQPVRDRIILQVYAKSERINVCLDADANSPKVYISGQAAENPPSMSAFYSVLRKYLMNARISSVALAGFDRVFEFKIDASDEMGFKKTLYIYAECIRKQSNIILCGEDAEGKKKIISALKPVDFSMSETRQVLNGFEYTPPASGAKTDPLTVTRGDFLSALESAAPDGLLCDWLLSNYRGFSPLVARETAFKASGKLADASAAAGAVDNKAAEFHFFELVEKIKNNNFTPTLLYDENGEKGALVDFSYIDIRQYGNKTVSKTFESMSELVDFYFYKKNRDNMLKQKSHDILKVLANASSRLNKKIRLLEREAEECKTKEQIKIYGDLITANIYRLEKGATAYSLENFYDETDPGRIITIAADKNLTPAQNAQKYYKKYGKLKSAEYHTAKQIDAAKDDIIYVDSVFESLARALSERELAEIREELAESGISKALKPGKTGKTGKSAKPRKQLPVSKPNEYTSANGFKILCGKNNRQNDELTFKTASKNDIWFHAQKIPGSHVILVCENTGRAPADRDIEDAAKIAAAYSKGKNMPLVLVDYTYARYVKKPAGAKPGFVTYANHKTAAVAPGDIEG